MGVFQGGVFHRSKALRIDKTTISQCFLMHPETIDLGAACLFAHGSAWLLSSLVRVDC